MVSKGCGASVREHVVGYRIAVEGKGLCFSAAHFAALPVGYEPLHGHNYAVGVEVEGALEATGWVLDFSVVRDAAAAICQELDHRFILPGGSPKLRVDWMGEEVAISWDGGRYVMPRQDVVVLPIDNSTAERLAEWFVGRLEEALLRVGAANLTRIAVRVEEAPGQAAWYARDVESAP